MAEYTVTINLPDHKLGDRWPGIASIGPVLINSAQPADALTRIRMQFRLPGYVYKLDSSSAESPDAPIVIDNATTWVARIPEVQTFLTKEGNWQWDMEFYQTGKTSPLTLYKGTLTVAADVTK